VADFLYHLKYKLLNCLTFDASGREFQTEAPENVNGGIVHGLLWVCTIDMLRKTEVAVYEAKMYLAALF